MSKSRQVQQEIEKKLQQVEEGYANFQSILKKLQGANTSVQKEKLETELKKEMKRLLGIKEILKSLDLQDQRFKSRIADAKKKIDELIELQKQSEKDPKIKVISREGPLVIAKIESHDEEKEDLREAIKNSQVLFQEKINSKESEIEKSRNLRVRALQTEEAAKQVRILRYHCERLDLVLRQIENDSVNASLVWVLIEKLEGLLKSEELNEVDQDIDQCYKEMNIVGKPLPNFPSLNDDEHHPQKRSNSKKQESKPVSKAESKVAEKGWNSKEAYVKIAGKPEKVIEDLPDDDIENVPFK